MQEAVAIEVLFITFEDEMVQLRPPVQDAVDIVTGVVYCGTEVVSALLDDDAGVVIVSVIGTVVVRIEVVVPLLQLLQGRVRVCVAVEMVVITSVEAVGTTVVTVSVTGTSVVLMVVVVPLPQLLHGRVRVWVAVETVVTNSVETETEAGRVWVAVTVVLW